MTTPKELSREELERLSRRLVKHTRMAFEEDDIRALIHQALKAIKLEEAIEKDAKNRMDAANKHNQGYCEILEEPHEPYADWRDWIGAEARKALSQDEEA